MHDRRRIGDDLVGEECPTNPRTGIWENRRSIPPWLGFTPLPFRQGISMVARVRTPISQFFQRPQSIDTRAK
jgi:hypothetical protein